MTTKNRLSNLNAKLASYSNETLTPNELRKIGQLNNTNYAMTKIVSKKYGIKVKTWNSK